MEKIMPIYEYACPNCQNVFEKWLKIVETTENAPCPKCGNQAQRIISDTAFVLKGGGWYVTDYGYRKGANEDGQTAASNTETPSTSAPASDAEHNVNPAPVTGIPSRPASGATNGVSA